MARTFRAALYTPHDLSDPHTAQALWRLLSDPLIAPRRFDSVERARLEFTSDSHDKASAIYRDEGWLFVCGSKHSFTAMFSRQRGGWAMWTFWWDVKAMMGRGRDAWLDWLFPLCRELPPFYGLGCSEAEHDAKHVVVETFPGGGSATAWVGVSAANFSEFLPGMYWLTIFGPQLVDHFGVTLESLAGTTYATLGPSGVAVTLDAPIVPDDMDERLRFEAELGNSLGATYIFDRHRAGVDYQLVPELARALHDLKERQLRGAQDEHGSLGGG